MAIAQRPITTAKDFTLKALAGRIAGEVITREHAAYDAARAVFNRAVDRQPGAIVRVADAVDVSEAVRYARAHGLEIAVRSGGHSIAGFSTADDAVVVDLSGLRNFRIDPMKETVWVQPGVTTGDLMGPASELGFALTTGDASSVGLGGLTLGGGIGWLVRKHGLTIDSLIAAEVVTADGTIVRASETEHADLFWAIRGGGGNFGIVTAFEFRLARVSMVLGGALVLPATPEVLRGYLEYARNAPDELTTITMMMAAPPAPFVPAEKVGTLSLMILVCYEGDLDEGQRVVAPLRALAEPIADAVAPIPYPVMYRFTEESTKPAGVHIRSAFTHEISDAFIERSIELAGAAPSPGAAVQFRPLGGAMGRVPAGATAFAHRDAGYLVAVLGLWQDAATEASAREAWVESVWAHLAPLSTGVYSNFLGNEGEARLREAYPEVTYRRLAEVKRTYDPENVFHLNQNIKP